MRTHCGETYRDISFYHDNSEGNNFEICGLLSVPYTGYFHWFLQTCLDDIS